MFSANGVVNHGQNPEAKEPVRHRRPRSGSIPPSIKATKADPPVDKGNTPATPRQRHGLRKKPTRFGMIVRSFSDALVKPMIEVNWHFAIITVNLICLLVMYLAGAALDIIMPSGSPGTVLQYPYDVMKNIGPSDNVFYPLILASVTYAAICIFYTTLDYCRPLFVQRHMYQPRGPADFGNLGLRRTLVTQLKSICCIYPVYGIMFLMSGPTPYGSQWVKSCWADCNGLKLPEHPPSVVEFLIHFLFSYFIHDVLYFWLHWMLHRHNAFYQNVHKIHHEYSAPFAMVGSHLHPYEFIMTFHFTFLPPVACRSHPFTNWVGTVLGVVAGVEAHTGYKFSPLEFVMKLLTFGGWGGTEHHDVHHELYSCNYAPFFGHWDKLCGTSSIPPTVVLNAVQLHTEARAVEET